MLALILALASAEIYFQEKFEEGYESRWVKPTEWKKPEEMGKWGWTAGQWYADEDDKGIQTSQDARFYGYSAKMDKPFNNEGKDLVLQFTAKYEQDIDCGGAYIKLLPSETNQASFGGDAEYSIMFGPDVCGSTRKTHIILNYKGKNLESKEKFRAVIDNLSHMYTLILHPDNTFEYRIDGVKEATGSLEDGWDFLAPKLIPDPTDKKPADWVDDAKIPDPEDKKPEDWDDVPAEIPDPAAVKPDDWDDEDDGEWEPPMIPNPDYKGEWTPRMIDNPDYKGEWAPRMIDNPEYVADDKLYNVCKDCEYVGFELWQVKSGTIFDDIIVCDDVAEAEAFAAETFAKKVDAEKKMYEEVKEHEKQTQEEELQAASAAEDEDYEDEDL